MWRLCPDGVFNNPRMFSVPTLRISFPRCKTLPASENRGLLSAYYYPGLRSGSMPSEETAALQTNVKQCEKSL
ncbi:hypothetical protein EYF80_039103 [Liparis tanakae]|uniref:Uncharacterized protein n=1 Tax=Liparis tanakae TaxID=230148 RepID=A0A4Z2GDC0_9TELE|nr:hypothetical protein EYF80_039103 [Liparis tanakae]